MKLSNFTNIFLSFWLNKRWRTDGELAAFTRYPSAKQYSFLTLLSDPNHQVPECDVSTKRKETLEWTLRMGKVTLAPTKRGVLVSGEDE